ncbi:chemotaxis response regulator protein-glutamate methylesterase [Pseudomonas sp. 5P_3.1_Bac2]|uniref:protein-glutamate methylesterase/protein-glutamine glutaminase n=1 Tax=Pseudomonas sp. 5P_3.1_Bac2 TaxID=2971617 RepID=UPI0029056AD5|nr:chemotaxis response regulator protein-glutamate methylesterase [Pseudomonas sp. 5P_3.1_Bac2]
MTIKVLIVDDSAVMREVMQQMLAPYADIEVIGAAFDPLLAMQRMQQQWPDVLVLDIEMPRMDGLTFLRQIMASRPTPVVICSSLTSQGAAMTQQALAAGAVEVIGKPSVGLRDFLHGSGKQFVASIRAAAKARLAPTLTKAAPDVASLAVPARHALPVPSSERLVLMGASTGGTQALEYVLRQLPASAAPVLIVQHMPEGFTGSFAERLNGLAAIEVREAQHGDSLRSGLALIAPGGRHMLLKHDAGRYWVEIKDGPLVSRHRPSVDMLFRSAALLGGRNVLAVLMTGMGNDGARGLLALHEAGASTVAQDEHSCVVFGMPKEAIKLGAADQVLGLDEIAAQLLAWA